MRPKARRRMEIRKGRIDQGLNPSSREILIGLTGPAGVGKDTIAALLARHGFRSYALAAPLKLGLSVMLDLPHSVWDRDHKEQVIPWLGKSPRQLAQTLGTEWGRQMVRQDLWVLLMQRHWETVRTHVSPRMVVTDVRFDSEAEAIHDMGGTVWKVLRENVPPVNSHVSEAGISPSLVDGVIKNYKGLSELEADVPRLVEQWVRRFSV